MKGVLSMAFVPLRNIYGEHLRENVRFPIKRGGEIYEIYDTSYSISTYPYQWKLFSLKIHLLIILGSSLNYFTS